MDTELTRRLTLLLLGCEPGYSFPELGQAAEVDPERVMRLWQALGLASPNHNTTMFTDADVNALKLVNTMGDLGVSLATQLAAARAWGQAMARVAEWQVEMMRELATPTAHDSGPGQAQDRVLSLGSEMMPVVEQFQQYVWRRHLLAAAERLLSSTAPAPGDRTLAVGFADIVGYTDLSRGLTDVRLAQFIEAFEAQSAAVVTGGGGRVIKTLGDEVMFVADQPEAAAEIALCLAEMTSSLDGRPNLHIGLAYGHVLHHLGDVHGPVVNLASRLTTLARPGTVLVDSALAGALTMQEIEGVEAPRYALRRLRPQAMRGFPNLQPWLLRRAPVRPRTRRPAQVDA